ncbi:TPR domain protein [Stemphylium lycopersici]|uniref:TPR domain protein n=1 Tax=Stemphylium lycopersici TaxID=183478 RepID=A0A364MWP2_STELY|nr:tpr domain-containing protein [Stemphylium lycopersici]RAR01050.1 TPR domain protein [Stemphylium lycopersici]RAR05875.1 TPR domain protein [Stemphylium lycopersici]
MTPVCFEAAIASDPTCAIAYWGLAYALGPNYNKPWELFDKEDLKNTLSRVQDAIRKGLMHAADPIERALIHAIRVRYPSDVSDTRYPYHNRAYAEAMSLVYKAYPKDLDVVTLYADALINIAPWALWDLQTGEPNTEAGTMEAKEILDNALEADSASLRHPGLLHVYTHLMEMSSTPETALATANHLRNLVPDAGHMRHMPSHLDILVGNWACAIEANAAASIADEKYRLANVINTMDFYTMYRLHNYSSLIYAAMFAGRSKTAMAAVLRMEENIPEQLLRVESPPMADWLEPFCTIRVHVLIRFGRWDELITLPLAPPEDQDLYCTTTAILHYGKGIAFAALGRVAEASQQRELFQASVRRVPVSRMIYPNKCSDMLAVAKSMLDGEIEYRKGNFETAFTHLNEAIMQEDALVYSEPPAWMQPVRHALGALSLEQGRFKEASTAYAADLGLDKSVPRAKWHPNNIWALHGYHECLVSMGELEKAEDVAKNLKAASDGVDVKLSSSCFCRGRSIMSMPSQ